MGKHIQQDHMSTDHFVIDVNDQITHKPKARGGGRLTNTPATTTTAAGTKYKVNMTLSDGSQNEIELDNTNFGIKYTGTASKTLLFMASMSASSDTNATACQWELYKNTSATGVLMDRYFDKSGKSGSFTLAGRIDVVQNDLIHIHVSSDIAGAIITHTVINIEVFEV